jgi:signal transduction histidine kinase
LQIRDQLAALDAEQQWEGYDEEGGRITRDRFVTPRALKGEHVTGVEFLHHPPTGNPVWTRVSGVPLRDASGTVTGAISVIVDIDEQKRGQQALAQAAQRLEQEVDARTLELREALARLEAEAEDRARAEEALRQAQKMEAVGQLTGGIAHDFNNMLTGIIGAIDILKRRIASGRLEDLDRFMDAASTSAQRAAALTARLLAFSRRQSLDSKPTDIGNLVHSLEDLLRRTMSESIEVEIVSATSLPPALVDANQLESAIINLAINARDAMPDGGRLTLACEEQELDAAFCARNLGVTPGRYVVVAVSDTGVGMDAATLDKVFDPFFTTKPIGQGTGLGLSMVYGFAKQSNGLVRVHSTLGEGTSVKIFLPVADAEPEEQTAESAPIHHGDGQSVLLVEDDESVRLLVRDVLEELGYKATEAPDGQQAVRILEDGQRFDLMISDVGLPGMNGRQLAEIAREHLPDLPILFVTGYAESAAVRGGFLSNNMQMIAKPFQIEMLSARIREMLES